MVGVICVVPLRMGLENFRENFRINTENSFSLSFCRRTASISKRDYDAHKNSYMISKEAFTKALHNCRHDPRSVGSLLPGGEPKMGHDL